MNRIQRALLLLCLAGHNVSAMAAVMGLNKVDLAWQFLHSADGTQPDGVAAVTEALAMRAIQDASDLRATFLRVGILGHHNLINPISDIEILIENPRLYWSRMDAMMDALDAAGLKLVPVLSWKLMALPEYFQESTKAFLNNPDSRSWQFLANFVTEFVSRYKERETVLFYELANETNLRADTDILRRYCKNNNSRQCLFEANVTSSDVLGFIERFANLVRAADPSRKLSSGSAMPLKNAENLKGRPEWIKTRWRQPTADSRQDFIEHLITISRSVDIISVHIYPGVVPGRFGARDATATEVIQAIADAGKIAGKPVFIGEFGDRKSRDGISPFMNSVFRSLGDENVQYASPWVFEFYQTNNYTTYDNPATTFNLEPGYTDDVLDELYRLSSRQSDPQQRPVTASLIVAEPPPGATVDQGDFYLHVVATKESHQRITVSLDGKRVSERTEPPYVFRMRGHCKENDKTDVEVSVIPSGNTQHITYRCQHDNEQK